MPVSAVRQSLFVKKPAQNRILLSNPDAIQADAKSY
jgi:hypothetical protein